MRRGPLYITVAGILFTIMVSLVKIARAELDTVEVVFWRGFVAVPLAYVVARPAGLRLHNVRLFMVRVGLGFAAMFCFFTAAKGLAVADLTLISKLQPIAIAIAAPFFLGASERSGKLVWLLMATGLAGSALILAPELSVGSTFGLWALSATMLAALAHIAVRALTRTDDPRVMVFYFMVGVMVLSTATMMIEGRGLPEVPDLHLWPYLVGIGVAATGGQLLMTKAYAVDRATVVAAASYSTPIWALIADLTIFATVPGWTTAIGGLVIVSAGLYLLFGHGLPPEPPAPGV